MSRNIVTFVIYQLTSCAVFKIHNFLHPLFTCGLWTPVSNNIWFLSQSMLLILSQYQIVWMMCIQIAAKGSKI